MKRSEFELGLSYFKIGYTQKFHYSNVIYTCNLSTKKHHRTHQNRIPKRGLYKNYCKPTFFFSDLLLPRSLWMLYYSSFVTAVLWLNRQARGKNMTENQRIWDVKDMPDLPLVKLKLMRPSVHVCLFFLFKNLSGRWMAPVKDKSRQADLQSITSVSKQEIVMFQKL